MAKDEQKAPKGSADGSAQSPPKPPAAPPVTPPAAKAPAQAEEKKTPTQWAEFMSATMNSRQAMHFRAAHAAANVLHGWAAEQYHAGRAMRLTLSQYKAALDAVNNHTRSCEKPRATADGMPATSPEPFADALSTHRGKRT